MNDKRRNDRYQAQQALMARMQKDVNRTPHWSVPIRVKKTSAFPLAKRIAR